MKLLIVASVLVLVVVVFMAMKNTRTPSGLGLFDGRLAPVPKSPNAVSSQTDDATKRVAPFPFKGSLENTRTEIKKALEAYGNIVVQSEKANYLHAVSTTKWLRFKDDLEFLFDETARMVHFRSASRVGYSDLGMNKKRYQALMKRYTTNE